MGHIINRIQGSLHVKLNRILFAIAAAAGTHAALAEVIDPAGLGQAAATMQFCAGIDPADSATFQAMWNGIVGAGQSQLAGIEASSGYKQSFERVTAMLKALPAQELAAGCAGGASEWSRHGGRHGDDSHKDAVEAASDEGRSLSRR
jgi:hypothetical protein